VWRIPPKNGCFNGKTTRKTWEIYGTSPAKYGGFMGKVMELGKKRRGCIYGMEYHGIDR